MRSEQCIYCKTELTGLDCPECGGMCEECLGYAGASHVCFRCQARRDGRLCVDCGSPWIYIVTVDDEALCRVSMGQRIRDNGWDQPPTPSVAPFAELSEPQVAKRVDKPEEAAKML